MMKINSNRYPLFSILILSLFMSSAYGANSEIEGVWHSNEAPGQGRAGGPVVFFFLPDGKFAMGQDGDPTSDPSGQDGVEIGTYEFDGTTLSLPTILEDTNGGWGLSNAGTSLPATVVGDTLTIEGSSVLTRVASSSLVGGYLVEGTPQFEAIAFLEDQTFMFLHAAGVPGDCQSQGQGQGCEAAGIEFGTYTWNDQTGAFTFSALTNTNTTIGLSSVFAFNILVINDSLAVRTVFAGEIAATRVATGVSNTPMLTNRLKNLATRGFVGTGDNVLIGGLVISGTENKTVIIRAKGPALVTAGLLNTLSDPQMTLLSGATVIDSNDDYQDHANVAQIPTDLIPTDSRESVIVTTLAPGAYTAIVNGVNDEEGIGIVEVFELEDTGETRVINIATRGFIGTGDNVLIGGLIITGTGTKKLVIRAKGPSLSAQGVSGTIANPQMFLFLGPDVIDNNDDWQSHARAAEVPDNLQPDDALESVIFTELSPGAYTVIVQGVDGGTGIGIVEVFEIQ
jgi:hypothetical protein